MGERMRWADGFIAVDWGTTNRRAYLIAPSGECVDEFEDGNGILSVPAGGFEAAVNEIRQRLGDKPLLLAGMVPAATAPSSCTSSPRMTSARPCPM